MKSINIEFKAAVFIYLTKIHFYDDFVKVKSVSFSPLQRVLDFRQPPYYPRPIAMPAIAAPKRKRFRRKVSKKLALTFPAQADGMVMRLDLGRRLTDDQLSQFSVDNRDLRIEQTAEGELIIMPPAFGDTGNWELELGTDLNLWVREVGGGKIFGPSAGFKLPNRAILAPDVSWLSPAQLNQLPPSALHSFIPLCPAFVLELRSHSDRLPTLQRKMVEYLENGAQLGWLIDPLEKQVFVYRPGQSVEHLDHPATLSGEPVLAKFTLDLTRVW